MTETASNTESRPDDFSTITAGVVGVGLLGGSVLSAVKKRFPKSQTLGIVRSAEAAESLSMMSFIDDVTPHTDRLAECDVIVIATPVDHIATWVKKIATLAKPTALITDVGSTKATIANACSNLETLQHRFVPAHPIAGSEKSGAAAADEDLFENKVTILTPIQSSSPEQVRRCHAFWQSLGSRTVETTPEIHDRELAAISHVPHLMASLLALLPEEASLDWTGTGWSDMTRVAAGDPTMWTAIVSENADAISDSLQQTRTQIDQLLMWIEQKDLEAIHDWFAQAKARKDIR